MPNLFTISNLLYIISSIEEILYMSESPLRPEISYTGHTIEIDFYLKNGKSNISIGSQEHGFFKYMDDDRVILSSAQFTIDAITDSNGSFHKAFRHIRSFDREYSRQAKNVETSIDRASFGLDEVN